jgi:hypothetical protein
MAVLGPVLITSPGIFVWQRAKSLQFAQETRRSILGLEAWNPPMSMERPATLNRSMPSTLGAVIGLPPKARNALVTRINRTREKRIDNLSGDSIADLERNAKW